MSTIRRVSRPADNFTILSNGFLRDSRLSLDAIGLGAWLLSHAIGWETSVKTITRQVKAGRDKVNRILAELEECGYLRRVQERDDEGRLGAMLYEIQDVPFEGETPDGDRCLKSRNRPTRNRSARTHKKTTSKKTITPEEQDPSGGTTAGAAGPSLKQVDPIHEEEEPVAKPAPQDTLFDVPAPAKAKKAESPSARTVVAAFVDSYRTHHSGATPVKSAVGRVARDAKAILDKGDAGPEELAEAARGMGEGIWSNLAVALNIHRQGGQKRKGFTAGTPARPHTDPDWVEAAERVEAETYQRLLADDDLVSWMAQDPAEVAKWTTRYPELEQRFRDVA